MRSSVVVLLLLVGFLIGHWEAVISASQASSSRKLQTKASTTLSASPPREDAPIAPSGPTSLQPVATSAMVPTVEAPVAAATVVREGPIEPSQPPASGSDEALQALPSSIERYVAARRANVSARREWHRRTCRASWRLPSGQTRFCRAVDGRMALNASPLRVTPPPQLDHALCDASSPASIINCTVEGCVHPHKGCLLAIPSEHCSHPTVVVPFRNASLVPYFWRFEAAATLTLPPYQSDIDDTLGFFDGFPLRYIQACADLALQSYCNKAFQLVPAKHHSCNFLAEPGSEHYDPACVDKKRMSKCVVYRQFFHRRGALQPIRHMPWFAFMHKAEWRPSLLRDDLRLALLKTVSSGPVLRVPFSSGTVVAPTVRVALRRRFGELVPLGLTADVRVTLSVTTCPTDVRSGPIRTPVLVAEREAQWSSVNLSKVVALSPSTATMAFTFSPLVLDEWVGCQMRTEVVAHVADHTTTAATPALPTTVRKWSAAIVHYESSTIELILRDDDADLAPRDGTVDERTPSNLEGEAFPESRSTFPTFRGPECAAHLRSDECCLRGITARYMSPVDAGRRETSASTYASSSAWDGHIVKLATVGPPHPCVSIVDGHMSSFDPFGVISWPTLVIRQRCTTHEFQAFLRTNDTNTVRIELLKHESTRFVMSARPLPLPLAKLARCAEARSGAPEQIVVGPTALEPATGGSHPLFSVAVHQSLDALRRQLRNIRNFAANGSVVLHIAPFWHVRMTDILKLNGTVHERVFLNPQRYPHAQYLLAFVLLNSARYVHDNIPWLPWTHVVLFASNELLIRSGIEAYLSRYDMSTPERPYPSSSVAVRHSHSLGRPWIEFVDPDASGRTFSYWEDGEALAGALLGEFSLQRMLRNVGFTKLSTHQRYTEGSFFRRSIAVLLSRWYDTYLNRLDDDCTDVWMAVDEAFLYQIFQDACRGGVPQRNDTTTNFEVSGGTEVLRGVGDRILPPRMEQRDGQMLLDALRSARCGERTGTVAWQGPNWYVSEDDIAALRCSPFETPFSMKRFDREDLKSKPAMMVMQVESDPVERRLLRSRIC